MSPSASQDSETTLDLPGRWNDRMEDDAPAPNQPAREDAAAPSQPASQDAADADQEYIGGEEYIGGDLWGSDSSTEAPASSHVGDLISINDELQDLGIVIGAAMSQIEDHKYARQLLQELDDLVTLATKAMSYIQVCLDDVGLKNADRSRVRQANGMLMDVKVGWMHTKSIVETMLREVKKRSSDIIDCGDGAAASSAYGEGHKHARHD